MGFFSRKPANVPRRRSETSGPKNADSGIFRPGRTLTGSLAPGIASAVEVSGDLQSSRARHHHLSTKRRQLTTILLGLVVVAGFLTVILYQSTVSIRISTSLALPQGQLQPYYAALSTYLDEHPLERLRPLFSHERFEAYARDSMPEILTVKQQGFGAPGLTDFSISMRRPVAGWIIRGKQYFVDERGVTFEKNHFDTPKVTVVDQSGIPQSSGTVVASSRFLMTIGRAVSIAEKSGLVITQAIIPQGTTRQVQVVLEGKKYPVTFSLDRAVAVQVEDMKRAVSYFDARGESPQYVDVRVGGRTYYR